MTRSFVRAPGRSLLAAVTAVLCCCPGLARDARAQTPAVELHGGYAYVADTEFNFPLGWYAGIGVPLRGAMTVVAEISRSQTTVVEFRLPVTFSVTSFQGGVRFQQRTGSVRPFVTVIGGVTRAGGGVDVGGSLGVGSLDFSVTSTAYTIQPGGGVVVPVTPGFGVTVGADYRWGGGDLGTLREFRFVTGVAIGLNRR